jgi:hypothetical protein
MHYCTRRLFHFFQDKHKTELTKKIEAITDKVLNISDEERCINSECNEEWDDWYNSDEDEYFFTDDQGVLDIMTVFC